jgi:isoquinoline 1-oxidoreductase subunit beta
MTMKQLPQQRPDQRADQSADQHPKSESRRSFLLGAGAFTVSMTFVGHGTSHAKPGKPVTNFSPSLWMTLATDGTVTLLSPVSEFGQGVMTSVPLALAEEMDLDWSKCKVVSAVVQAGGNAKVLGNPLFGGAMITGASRTTQGYWEPMRLAGAQARAVLIANAAAKWGVPADQVTTVPHACVHKASGRKLTYGQIAAFAKAPNPMPVVDKSQLKKPADFRLIGKNLPRVDGFDKVTGRAKYGIDQRLPGMRYASVLRPPVHGETPVSVDDTAARAMKGVRDVVRLPYGVAVVADNTWTAIQAKRALKVTWTTTSKARSYSTDKAMPEFVARANNPADVGVAMGSHGDTEGALKSAAQRIDATYTSEHVSHMCLEPMNATALVRNGKLELWAPSQAATTAIGVSSSPIGGFKPEDITVNITLIGGAFGRRVEVDFVLDAVLLAKAMPGTPVQAVWSREDDVMGDKLRPMTAQQVSAGVDQQGNLVAFKHKMVGESIFGRFMPDALKGAGGKDEPVCEGFEINYGVDNRLAQYLREERGVDVGFWRSVGGGYTKFAIESMIDELARNAKKDPLEYRLGLLAKQPRAQAVLREVAAMAKWDGGQAKGNRALGLAYSDIWNTHCAMVVDVSLNGSNIVVNEIWSAVDCGIALQPGNIARQIQGSAVWGVSAALKEKLTVKNGEFQQSNFNDYPVLRANESPRINVKVKPSDQAPGGIGEVGLPPVAPAIANAIASINGKRLRALPLTLA